VKYSDQTPGTNKAQFLALPVPPYPDILQRKLFSPFQSPKKKPKKTRTINPNFVSSSPLQSSCCITSKTAQAKLGKTLAKNSMK
jgi:hypothetical protein